MEITVGESGIVQNRAFSGDYNDESITDLLPC
jgi:hypothetical protein